MAHWHARGTDSAQAPGWLDILTRMCAVEESEVPFVGILEFVQDVDEGTWPATVRVFEDRSRYRVESLDGHLLTIRRPERTWEFRDVGEPPVRVDNEGGYRHVARGAHGPLIQRRPANEWGDDDFTRPTGPPRAVIYVGRDSWEVELAPPEHKPSPLVLTIDAATGMVLQSTSVEFGMLHRWTEIAEVESHPTDLFEWRGNEI